MLVNNSLLSVRLRPLLAVLMVLLGTCCTSVEDKRLRQLLNEKGFGSRAQGIATLENYVGGGDAIQFIVDAALLMAPGAEQLIYLTTPQPVGIDGTIYVPYIGNLYVLGMTEAELGEFVSEQLQASFIPTIKVTAKILPNPAAGTLAGKAFFALGETMAKGRMMMLRGDMTVFDAVMAVGWTPFANMGRVHLIRPDAENPLDVVINFRELALTGSTTYNIPIQDHDTIYIPATFFGVIARFLERLVQPIGLVVNAAIGAASAKAAYDVVSGKSDGFYGYGGRF